ncbi:testis-expressed protein 264 [Myripristis murdjan]|uniref:Testis expressed 264, ER-phagy receptor n=1 Tax=Myripristis murdjan TaxID=586833 RepID=A0A667X307_9TELE|nr:testis-expressed protein 264-like [Myripristis murdjan]
MPDLVCLCVIGLLLSVLTIAGFILYSGLLSEINIQTGSPPVKNITFAYKFKEEAHRNCGQLFKECRSVGPQLSCIGVFYDDPEKVSGQRCRCVVGSILSEGESKPSEELLKCYEKSGFSIFSFPEVTHVVTASFPHRTLFSSFLGVRRVYPRLEHYIKERRLCAHPFVEVYRGGQIQFIAPLARQGDFYVPEVRRVERRLSVLEDSHSDSEVSGADSEYSLGSGILLSDSRETSRAPSSIHSAIFHDQGGRDYGERSRASSLQEVDWELNGGQRARGDEPQHGASSRKRLDVTGQEWGVVAEGEE